MAWHLNQCWNIVKWTLRNKFQWKFNQNLNIFIQENALGNVVCEMTSILSRPQCVNRQHTITWASDDQDLWYQITSAHQGSIWDISLHYDSARSQGISTSRVDMRHQPPLWQCKEPGHQHIKGWYETSASTMTMQGARTSAHQGLIWDISLHYDNARSQDISTSRVDMRHQPPLWQCKEPGHQHIKGWYETSASTMTMQGARTSAHQGLIWDISLHYDNARSQDISTSRVDMRHQPPLWQCKEPGHQHIKGWYETSASTMTMQGARASAHQGLIWDISLHYDNARSQGISTSRVDMRHQHPLWQCKEPGHQHIKGWYETSASTMTMQGARTSAHQGSIWDISLHYDNARSQDISTSRVDMRHQHPLWQCKEPGHQQPT